MARPPGPTERVVVVGYVSVKQRRAVCYGCGTLYIGPAEKIDCLGCGEPMTTKDAGVKKIPTGVFSIGREKPAISNSSIIGEVPGDGESEPS